MWDDGQFSIVKKLILLLLFIPVLSFGQDQTHTDGPYIFIEKNKLIEKKIINGKVFSSRLNTSLYDTTYSPEKSTFNKIRNTFINFQKYLYNLIRIKRINIL